MSQRLGPQSWSFQIWRGFALIELLVVAALFTLLMGMLLPGISGAREAARTAVCTSNLRQWGAAVNAYALDNNGYLPRRGQGAQPTATIDPTDDWFNALPPNLEMRPYAELVTANLEPKARGGSLWVCPSAVDGPAGHFFAYGMNMRLSISQAAKPDRLDAVAPISRQVFLADAPGRYCSVLPNARPFSPIARHAQRVCIAFLDGHAAPFRGDYVGCNVGDSHRPDLQWLVPNSSWPGPG